MITLEERERLAYITNAPDAPLLGSLVDEAEDQFCSLHAEIEKLREELEGCDADIRELQEKLSVYE